MLERWKIIIVMLLLAAGSAWLLHKISPGKTRATRELLHQPDYFMENFRTFNMEQDGTLKNRLRAEHMMHYPDDNTTELFRPLLEIPRDDNRPINIVADKGWVTADNEVILLTGNVNLWQNDAAGNKSLEVITSDVRILVNQEYAETDKPATFINKDTSVKGVGVKAYLKEGRLKLLHNVHATISSEKTD